MHLKRTGAMLLVGTVLLISGAAAQSFRFAVVGDRTGRAAPGVYEQAWREVAREKPDFAVTVGDAIEGFDNARAAAEWDAVRAMWPAGLKIYHTPGNHDIWDLFSERLFTQVTGFAPSYSFDFRRAHFVVLDNSRREDLDAGQLAFLKTDLERHRGKSPVFVFFHRAYWLIPLKLGVNGFALQQIARQYGVCCILSGHGHQFQSVEQGGVLYVEVGSSGASLERAGASGIGYDDGWFYQYAMVSVHDRDVRMEIRELVAPNGQARVKVLRAR